MKKTVDVEMGNPDLSAQENRGAETGAGVADSLIG